MYSCVHVRWILKIFIKCWDCLIQALLLVQFSLSNFTQISSIFFVRCEGRAGRRAFIGIYEYTPCKHKNSNVFSMKIRQDATFSTYFISRTCQYNLKESQRRKYGPYISYIKFLTGNMKNLARVFSEKPYSTFPSFSPSLWKLCHSALDSICGNSILIDQNFDSILLIDIFYLLSFFISLLVPYLYPTRRNICSSHEIW
jgi:hypothetical protein